MLCSKSLFPIIIIMIASVWEALVLYFFLVYLYLLISIDFVIMNDVSDISRFDLVYDSLVLHF